MDPEVLAREGYTSVSVDQAPVRELFPGGRGMCPRPRRAARCSPSTRRA